MIIDQFNLIRAGTDGGDSCHRMFTYYLRATILGKLGLANKVPAAFDTVSKTAQISLQPSAGIYIRNPEDNNWVSDPLNVSRDQLTPVICYNAVVGFKAEQSKLLKASIKRYMFAQNIYSNGFDSRTATDDQKKKEKKLADFLLFDLWGVFARSYIKTVYAPIALPVILLGDAFLVLSAIAKTCLPITRDGSIKPVWPSPDDVDDENINNMLQTTQYVFPTPLSWLARKIYKTLRRKNYGNTQLGEKDAVMGAIAWYNRGDNPEMTELARPLVERY